MADEETPRNSLWQKNPGKSSLIDNAARKSAQKECSPQKLSRPNITKLDARRKLPNVHNEVATKVAQQEPNPPKHLSPKISKAAARRILPDVHNKVDTTEAGTSSMQVISTTKGIGDIQTDKQDKSTEKLVYAHDKGKSILTSLPVVQNYDSYSLIELEDNLVSSSNLFIDYLKIKNKDAIECDEMPNNATTIENVGVPENVADENVVVPDNVCGEAHEDEGNLDIIGSVSLIPTVVIDEFIEEIERDVNEALLNYPRDEGIKDALVEWRAKLLKFGKQMGDDNANISYKDHNLDNNTKDPFDSTQYNISCSMMEELENSLLSKYDGTNEKGKTRCDIAVANEKKVILCVKRSKMEDNVASTIFCANKNNWDFIFKTEHSAAAVTRVTFESYPGMDLRVFFLNCWVDVLNNEDQYRKKVIQKDYSHHVLCW
ncbi:hypothetical protein E3N88_32210 [Mikania micrantha]|uniref:Uncharacterized protein n=1 Tax=Mikania micrantha TaxID=192012 RepID=A0A5N6M921_9ASTR|nr:hypothetical protein E3N88_32210 [Mikania micrantha]